MISPPARRAHDHGANGSVQHPAARLDLKVRPLQAQRGRVCRDRRAPSDLDADRAVDLIHTPLSDPEAVRVRAWGQGALDVRVVSILVAREDPPLALALEFMNARGG